MEERPWIPYAELLPPPGARVEVSKPYKSGAGYHNNIGTVREYEGHHPQEVVLFAPDGHPKTAANPGWGFFMSIPGSTKYGSAQECKQNCWRYIDEPQAQKEKQVNIYAHAIRRMDGYQAVLLEGNGDPTDDPILWEGDTVYQDDEKGTENFKSGYQKALAEAEAVKQASLKAYIAAGVKAVAKNG